MVPVDVFQTRKVTICLVEVRMIWFIRRKLHILCNPIFFATAGQPIVENNYENPCLFGTFLILLRKVQFCKFEQYFLANNPRG